MCSNLLPGKPLAVYIITESYKQYTGKALHNICMKNS